MSVCQTQVNPVYCASPVSKTNMTLPFAVACVEPTPHLTQHTLFNKTKLSEGTSNYQ